MTQRARDKALFSTECASNEISFDSLIVTSRNDVFARVFAIQRARERAGFRLSLLGGVSLIGGAFSDP